MILKDFNETFKSELTDPEFAALYLKAALQDNGMEGFLLALRNVTQASHGLAQVATDADLGRENLDDALSDSDNPHFATVQKLLCAIGLQLSFEPIHNPNAIAD
jgi:probable addiction module antidote protein